MKEDCVNLKITDKSLGEGGEAVIFTAYLGEEKVAVKKLSKPEKEFEKLTREASKLKRLRHGKHITYIYGVTWENKSLYIVMKYYEHKDLQSYLEGNKGSVTDDQKIFFCRGILLGLLHCHSMKIFHGDIKCKNVIISSNLEPQLADFGFSISVDSIKHYEKPTYGTAHWVAPEIFSILDERVYQDFIADPYPCDVYSLGATFCEISYDGTKEFIDSVDEPDTDIMLGLVCPIPKNAFLQEIIESCCKFERNERISLNKCLYMLDNIAEKQLPIPKDDGWECIQKSIDPKQKQEYPLTFILHRPKKNLVLGPSNLSLLEWLCINDCRDAVDYMLQEHSLEQGQIKWLYGISRLCGSMVVAKFFRAKFEDAPSLESEADVYQKYLDSDFGRSFRSSYSEIRNTLSLSELLCKNSQQFIESLFNAGADLRHDSSLLHKAVEMHYNRIVRIFVKNKSNAKDRIAHNAVKATNVKTIKVLGSARFDLEGWDKSNGDTPLLTAINAENIEAVRILLSSGADIHKQNKHIENGAEAGNQHTPLYRAAMSGNRDIVALLIEFGATIDTESKEWQSLVKDLKSQKDSSMVQFIVDNMKEAPQNPAVKVTPLCSAIRDGQKNNARKLIDDGADVDEHDHDGYTSLHLAASSGDEQVVRILLNADANIDIEAQNSKSISHFTYSPNYFNMCTPLHIAVVKRHLGIVKLLIKSGANFGLRNEAGQTIMDIADNDDKEEIERIVRECVSVTENFFPWILETMSIETVKLLISSTNISVDTLNHFLCIAACHGNTETTNYLLERVANISTNYEGKNPFGWAISGGHMHLMQVFIENGADIHAKSENNDATLLHIAATAGHKDIVELLINKGIYIDSKDKEGRTPLFYAAINGHEETVDLLHSKESNVKLWEKAEDVDAMYKIAKQILYKVVEMGKLAIIKIFVKSGVEVDFENEDENTPLVAAIQSGREEVIQFLLDKGADINGQGSKITPLIAAIQSERKDVVQLLLDKGADLNKKSSETTPLIAAIQSGKEDTVQLLLEKGADINGQGSKTTPLIAAIQSGKEDTVQLLLKKGADLNGQGSETTPLIAAIQSGREDIAQLLLDKGADYGKQSSETTPLIAAIAGNQIKIVKRLLGTVDGGDDPNRRDQKGRLPILEAIRIGNTDITQLLIDHRADPKEKGKCVYNGNLYSLANIADYFHNDASVLHLIAVQKKFSSDSAEKWLNIAKLLIEKGADVNATDDWPYTPLHLVNNVELARLFIDKGAKVNAQGNSDRMPLHIVSNTEAAQLLIASKADIHAKDLEGKTPLFQHIEKSHAEIVALLVKSGADVNIKDHYENTPIQLAKKMDIAEILIGKITDDKIKKDQITMRLDALIKETSNNLAYIECTWKESQDKAKLYHYLNILVS